MGINPIITGGAILSGSFFGDRCSYISTGALLICELTGTNIYTNVKNMMRTCVVPFLVSCVLFFVIGLSANKADFSAEIWDPFKNNFNLKLVVILPALLIIVLCVFRVKVKKAMIVSILTASIISLAVQRTPFMDLLKMLIFGFQPADEQLSFLMKGGGVSSMVRVMIIIFISSCYAGIFEGTGLLKGFKSRIVWLSNKLTASGAIMITAIITGMVACNQTLSIMLTHYLFKDTIKPKELLALNLENTVVVISPLIPWSIACVVPLTAAGAPIKSFMAAFYLILTPIWNIINQKRTERFINC